MGTTPNLTLPYPEPGEAPAGAQQMQALAMAVDSKFASTTSDMTYAGATRTSSGLPLDRYGNWVELALDVRFTAAYTSGNVFATVPVGFRPRKQHRLSGSLGGTSVLLTIDTAGAIIMSSAAANNANLYITTCVWRAA